MLPRRNSFPLKRGFSNLQGKGRLYDSPSFGLLINFNKGSSQESGPLVGFIISKKVSGSSVIRHQVKRKLALACEPFLPQLAKTLSLVFLVKPGITNRGAGELGLELETSLRRAKLLS